MGVPARVVICSDSPSDAIECAAAAFAELARLDAVMSDYRPDSELSQLTSQAHPGPVVVSEDLFAVLQLSQQIAEQSLGAFDVTVGPLSALWRASRREHTLPDPIALAQACDVVGWRLMTLDPQTRSVRLAMPGMKLDLGGIGKGFAAQRAVELLQRRGIPRCMVALAGDIACGDPPPGTNGWLIEVPASNDRRPPRRIALANSAISTSGDLEQHLEINGVRYSHIVDPRTGLGVTHRRMVTVIAPRGELADALASAICVSPDHALAILRHHPGTAAIITASEASPPSVIDPDGVLDMQVLREP